MADLKGIDMVLGTMTFGSQLDEAGTNEVLHYFFEKGGKSIDTALAYNYGKTQTIIGDVLTSEQKKATYIASKVNNLGGNSFSKESIFAQVDAILSQLKVECLDLLYLHWPDRKIPLEETLGAIDALHKQGKFKEFGLSNYAAWEVVHVWYLCKTNGYVLPTVYQGMYNSITRDVEKELFPALRAFNIKFYAYNPLAGGILTGKHDFAPGGAGVEGRFQLGAGPVQNRYIERYWKADIFEALKILQDACAKHNISMTEASLRWIHNHSLLAAGDTIILGASKIEQLRDNIEHAQKTEKLPNDIVQAFDVAWEKAKPVCEQYWR